MWGGVVGVVAEKTQVLSLTCACSPGLLLQGPPRQTPL